MNQIKLKDLYAGKPDAKDEISYDGIDDFINSFVVPTSFDIEELTSGDKFFITGYKGVGKTALLIYLDNYLREIDDGTSTSFILFKEEFTDLRKSELEVMEKRILNSISISEKTLLDTTDFEYIWRWLFFKRIVSDNEYYNGQLFVNDSNWNCFKSLVDRIKAPSDNKKVIIPPKIRFSLPFKDYQNQIETSIEAEADFQNVEDKVYQQFISLIDCAESAFSKLNRTNIPYYIFVDELEAYYGDEKVFKRDLYLIRDLLFTVKRLNDHLKRIDPNTSKIFCSVRSEVLRAISRFIVTKELNKIVNGFEVPLTWNYTNTISYMHPIMQILIKRIAMCENLSEYNPKEVYQRWFPVKIHDIEPANFILNNTWFKPRDIVRLLLSVKYSIVKNNTSFTEAVFNACIRKYSNDSLQEITEELSALYNSSEIDSILSCFTGFRTTFSVSQLRKRVESQYQNTVLSKNFVQVIEDLYRLGFLGNYLPLSKSFRWQHKGADRVILDENWRLMIHQGLQTALSVGITQNYALKCQDLPEFGDVFEVKVLRANRSFVFVEFEKYGNPYEGVIHVADYAQGRYIKYLQAEVSKGDVLCCEVLGYNEKFDNWKMRNVTGQTQ